MFCSESLLNRLTPKERNFTISVSTVGNVVTNCETSISCLEIVKLDEDMCFEVPTAFSAKSLNIS